MYKVTQCIKTEELFIFCNGNFNSLCYLKWKNYFVIPLYLILSFRAVMGNFSLTLSCPNQNARLRTKNSQQGSHKKYCSLWDGECKVNIILICLRTARPFPHYNSFTFYDYCVLQFWPRS